VSNPPHPAAGRRASGARRKGEKRGDDRGKNPGDDRVETIPVLWAYESPDTKGRVFVSIFGHFMWTFDDPYFRLMLLRGMAWSAKDDVYRFDKLAVDGVELAK